MLKDSKYRLNFSAAATKLETHVEATPFKGISSLNKEVQAANITEKSGIYWCTDNLKKQKVKTRVISSPVLFGFGLFIALIITIIIALHTS